MKKILIFKLTFFICAGLFASYGSETNSFQQTDSSYIFTWSNDLNDWKISSVQRFVYLPNGKLSYMEERSFETGSEISRTEYLYNNNQLLSELTAYRFTTSWTPTLKNVFSYNMNDQIEEVFIKVFENGHFVDNRWQKNYVYNEDGLLLEFQSFYWRNGTWSTPTTDYSTYGEDGLLIKREAFYSNGRTDYQIIYSYNGEKVLTEAYSQYPSGTAWKNWWKNEYHYDDCNLKNVQVRYTGYNSDWIPQTKTVSFTSFRADLYPGRKIPVCHKGKTIYISKNAIKAHLAHGDCVGECTGENNMRKPVKEKENEKEAPFKVFPNPATDKITIQFDDDDCFSANRVELIDYYGKKLVSISAKGKREVIIPKGKHPEGSYYLKVIGEETYSVIIIFK